MLAVQQKALTSPDHARPTIISTWARSLKSSFLSTTAVNDERLLSIPSLSLLSPLRPQNSVVSISKASLSCYCTLIYLKMPGTHLLPPNLLKLFAPRPPLPWLRAVGKDIDRVTKKDVGGVAHLLAQLKEANTETLITSGEAEAMEEGEEPIFTHAEEIKRQIRREERKARRTEEFKIAKETCMSLFPFSNQPTNFLFQTSLLMILRLWVTHTRRYSSLVWYKYFIRHCGLRLLTFFS